MLCVPLNSFVHRVYDKTQFIELASQHKCQLKRIRRSRHWQLSGEEHALRALKSALVDERSLWIVKAIDKALPLPVIDLSSMIAATPNISVKQLVSLSGCSLSEARMALDEFEDL